MNNSQYTQESMVLNHFSHNAIFQSSLTTEIKRKQQLQQEIYMLDYQRNFMAVTGHSILKKTLNSSWSERYFLLTPTRLLYFSDSSMRDFKGCFNLASLVEHRLKVKASFPIISLVVWVVDEEQSQKTLIQLKIEDEDVFIQWQYQLTKVICQLQMNRIERRILFPKIKSKQLLESNHKLGNFNGNFWNSLHISQNQLLKYASHLDIILFRSKNPLSYVHRFFMGSYYDHIAILIKDQSGQVFAFEAIRQTGVCISNLQSILNNFGSQYDQIGYRKLLIKDNATFNVEKLEEYINSILGSKYELSLTKLLIDNSTIKNQQLCDTDEEEVSDQQKTYFCSELVADIYLKFGILTGGKSNKYWPKDFQSDDIIFSQSYSFSPVMKLQLNDLRETSELSDI